MRAAAATRRAAAPRCCPGCLSSVPVKVASGDFNRDGVVDLVTVNMLDRTVSVLIGLGSGRFAPNVDYPAADDGLAVADFDRDGKLDLAVLSNAGDVSIMAGNDDGSFQSPARVAQVGARASAVAAGDFDKDGIPDLAVATGASTLIVLRGSEPAHSRSSIRTRSPGRRPSPSPTSIVTATSIWSPAAITASTCCAATATERSRPG